MMNSCKVFSQLLKMLSGDGVSFKGAKLITTLSFSALLLIVFVIVSCAESVPAADFRGQKEVVVMSGRSLYWPYSLSGGGGENQDRHHNHHHQQHLETEKRTVQPIQLCGYRLLEAVRGLCRGNYVGFSRRSDPDMEDDEHMMMGDSTSSAQISDDEKQDLSDSPSQNRHRHQKSRHQHLRVRRNIIDECCMKPCSANVMLRYCGRT